MNFSALKFCAFSLAICASTNALADAMPLNAYAPQEPSYIELMQTQNAQSLQPQIQQVRPSVQYAQPIAQNAVVTQNIYGGGMARPVLISQDVAPKTPLTAQQLQNIPQPIEAPKQLQQGVISTPSQSATVATPNSEPLSMQSLQPQMQNTPMNYGFQQNVQTQQPSAPVKRLNSPTGYGVGAPSAYGSNTGRYYIGIWGDIMKPSKSTVSAPAANASLLYNTSYGVAGSVGYYLYDNVRLEGEVSIKEHEVEGATLNGATYNFNGGDAIRTTGLGVNAYYDIKEISTDFVPYVGAGLGYQFVTSGDGTSGLSGQLMAGVSYNIDQDLAVFTGYKYFKTQDLKSGESTFSITDNIAELGMRYNF